MKRIATSVLALCFILAFALSACGQGESAVQEDAALQSVVEPSAGYYAAAQASLSVEDSIYTVIDTAANGSGLVLARSNARFALLNCEIDGSAELTAIVETAGQAEPYCIASDSTGCAYVASFDESAEMIYIDCYLNGERTMAQYMLESANPPTMLAAAGETLLLGIARNRDPHGALTTTICLIHPEEMTVLDTGIDYYADILSLDDNTFLIYGGVTDRSVDVEPPTDYTLWTMDAASGTVTQQWDLGNDVTLLNVAENEALLVVSGRLWSFSLTTGELETDWLALASVGFGASDTVTGGYRMEDTFLLFLASGKAYTVSIQSDGAPKEIVTLGYLQGEANSYFLNRAANYNLAGRNYSIELIAYETAGELGLDIAAGVGPDLVDVAQLPLQAYLNKNLLEDLNGWFAQDSEISRSELQESVISLYETGGALYTLPVSFVLWGLEIDERILGDADTITMEQR